MNHLLLSEMHFILFQRNYQVKAVKGKTASCSYQQLWNCSHGLGPHRLFSMTEPYLIFFKWLSSLGDVPHIATMGYTGLLVYCISFIPDLVTFIDSTAHTMMLFSKLSTPAAKYLNTA